MRFDLRKFSRVMLWIAIIGIVGNQLVFVLTALNEISAHNDAVAIVHSHKKSDSSEEAVRNLALSIILLREGGEEWTPDYINLLFNPADPFENMSDWSLLNHLLAWTGIAALMLFLVLRLSMVSRPARLSGIGRFAVESKPALLSAERAACRCTSARSIGSSILPGGARRPTRAVAHPFSPSEGWRA